MTEEEFTERAKKRGLREDNIKSAIDNFYLTKKEPPNLVLNEMIIECAIKAQEKSDNETDDFVTLD
jgi:hypothetical protein